MARQEILSGVGVFWEATKVKLNAMFTELYAKNAVDLIAIVTGTLTATGYITGKKTGVLTYLAAPKDVIVGTPGTFVPITGTYIQPVIEDFTDLDPGMQYDGTKTQWFKIDWHAQVTAASANTTFSAASSLGGVVNDASAMSHFLKNAAQPYTLSGTWAVELSTGDILGASVTADIAQTLTVNAVQITVTEFFD